MKLGNIFKNIFLTGLAALVFGCTQLVDPEMEGREKRILARGVVDVYNEDELAYIFTYSLTSFTFNYEWVMQMTGRISNENGKDIIGLRPYLRTYEMEQGGEMGSELTSNYGHLGKKIVNGASFEKSSLRDTVDVLQADSSAMHLTDSDRLYESVVYWQFNFGYFGGDSSLGKIANDLSLEGKIER